MTAYKIILFLIALIWWAAPAHAAAPCIRHAFTSNKSDPADTTLIKPSDWNACHTIEDGAVMTPSSTDTFTNKTLDAEATGNNITIPTYWDLDLAGCIDSVAGGLWNTYTGDPPTYACDIGTNRIVAYAVFANDGIHEAQISRWLPTGWGGQLDARILWWTSATSGDVVFQVATKCYASGEADDAVWNTAKTVTQTAQGTTNRLNVATMTAIDTTGCAANEVMRITFYRNSDHASDTLAASANVSKVIFTARITH